MIYAGTINVTSVSVLWSSQRGADGRKFIGALEFVIDGHSITFELPVEWPTQEDAVAHAENQLELMGLKARDE